MLKKQESVETIFLKKKNKGVTHERFNLPPIYYSSASWETMKPEETRQEIKKRAESHAFSTMYLHLLNWIGRSNNYLYIPWLFFKIRLLIKEM